MIIVGADEHVLFLTILHRYVRVIINNRAHQNASISIK